MKTPISIPASELSPLPDALFPRHENSDGYIAELAEALRGGAVLPPILVDGERRVVDGYHRWKAHVEAFGPGAPVPCHVKRYGTEGELFLDALRENAKHGLRFNVSDQNRCSAIAHRLKLGTADLAEALSTSPARAAAISDGRASLPSPKMLGADRPELRAQESAEKLLRLLGSGQLRQNAAGLEKDFRRLAAAIDAYLERAEGWASSP